MEIYLSVGHNGQGQLGQGNTTESNEIEKITVLDGVIVTIKKYLLQSMVHTYYC